MWLVTKQPARPAARPAAQKLGTFRCPAAPQVHKEWGVIGYECKPVASSLISLASLGVAVLLAVWAGGRRTAMREQLGIPGSRAWDTVGWLLCHSCALAQVTMRFFGYLDWLCGVTCELVFVWDDMFAAVL